MVGRRYAGRSLSERLALNLAWKPDLKAVQELDPGIALIVNRLREYGVETYESCEGGEGHCFPEPTVRFACGDGGQWQALGVARMLDMPVTELRQVWTISRDGVPTGPNWEMVFRLDGYIGAPYAEQIAERRP